MVSNKHDARGGKGGNAYWYSSKNSEDSQYRLFTHADDEDQYHCACTNQTPKNCCSNPWPSSWYSARLGCNSLTA